MKLNNRIALTFALSAALFSASALAQDSAAAAPTGPVAEAPAAAPAMAKHKHHKMARSEKMSGSRYDSCLKQKLAVAEYFCGIHADSCKSEKDGAATQCRAEARGVRQKG